MHQPFFLRGPIIRQKAGCVKNGAVANHERVWFTCGLVPLVQCRQAEAITWKAPGQQRAALGDSCLLAALGQDGAGHLSAGSAKVEPEEENCSADKCGGSKEEGTVAESDDDIPAGQGQGGKGQA